MARSVPSRSALALNVRACGGPSAPAGHRRIEAARDVGRRLLRGGSARDRRADAWAHVPERGSNARLKQAGTAGAGVVLRDPLGVLDARPCRNVGGGIRAGSVGDASIDRWRVARAGACGGDGTDGPNGRGRHRDERAQAYLHGQRTQPHGRRGSSAGWAPTKPPRVTNLDMWRGPRRADPFREFPMA